MALLPSKNDRKKIGAEDITITDDVQVDLSEKIYSAKDRKPIQLDPPVLKKIRDIAYVKDIPMYELVKIAIDSYIETLDEDEIFMYKKRNDI